MAKDDKTKKAAAKPATKTVAKAAAPKAKEPKAPKEPKVKKPGVGDVAREMIMKGATNDEVLAAVQKQFPDGKTGMASINWYRNQLRQEHGDDVKTSREMKASQKPAKEPKAAKAAKGKDAAKGKGKDAAKKKADDFLE